MLHIYIKHISHFVLFFTDKAEKHTWDAVLFQTLTSLKQKKKGILLSENKTSSGKGYRFRSRL